MFIAKVLVEPSKQLKQIIQTDHSIVKNAGKISAGFAVLTGIKQGYLLSPFLFLLAVDWIYKKDYSKPEKRNPVDPVDPITAGRPQTTCFSFRITQLQLQEKTSDLYNCAAGTEHPQTQDQNLEAEHNN